MALPPQLGGEAAAGSMVPGGGQGLAALLLPLLLRLCEASAGLQAGLSEGGAAAALTRFFPVLFPVRWAAGRRRVPGRAAGGARGRLRAAPRGCRRCWTAAPAARCAPGSEARAAPRCCPATRAAASTATAAPTTAATPASAWVRRAGGRGQCPQPAAPRLKGGVKKRDPRGPAVRGGRVLSVPSG